MELFWCPFTQTTCLIFKKISGNIYIWYKCTITNLSFCYNLFLSYVDNRHTHRHNKKKVFWIQDIPKGVNSEKSPFWKFDPKTVLSLPYMGKRSNVKVFKKEINATVLEYFLFCLLIIKLRLFVNAYKKLISIFI